jgi:transcriptional regulator with XRE-family HTH domain
MQPAPPAAYRLAQRLRQLRQQWPQLTQEHLATALGTEKNLTGATVSSWESLKSPTLPPVHRLRAYARFFSTPRSMKEGVGLLRLEELTEDEREAYKILETELLRLRREATGGESPEEEPTFKRSWHFQDAGRVTFICAELPDYQKGPLADPKDPNYTELQRYADIDALMELHGHIRAENPTAIVHFKTPPDVEPDHLTGHLVLIGGVVWNEITGRLAQMAKLPIRQVEVPELDSGEIFVVKENNDVERQFQPEWIDAEEGKKLVKDVGLFVRVPNPLNANRTLTICNGIHSRGVYGAVRALTDAELRDNNEGYIARTFGDAGSFAILMSVQVIKDKTMTPDFNSPDVVLYEWPQDAA